MINGPGVHAMRRRIGAAEFTLAAVLAFAVAGFGGAQPAPTSAQLPQREPIPLGRIAMDGVLHDAIRLPRYQIIDSETEWKRLWSQIASISRGSAHAPTVDFRSTMVVLAALGHTGRAVSQSSWRPTGRMACCTSA